MASCAGDCGPACYNRGLALARVGESRAAIASFPESLRDRPERIESYLYLADLHLRLGERDSALALLDQARTLSPSDPRINSIRQRAGEKPGR
jgi:tetratricopeptide (TPR) repeat protein